MASAAGIALGGVFSINRLDASGTVCEVLYRRMVMPAVTLLDAEQAHRAGLIAASTGLLPRQRRPDNPTLRTMLFGRVVSNPIGLAAGFDKDGEAIEGLFGLGFGMIEVGSVTPLPQPGNPKPRVFRLPEDRAVINRYGFNSIGHAAVAKHLDKRTEFTAALEEGAGGPGRMLGINLGKNKTSPDAVADYVAGVRELGRYADYLVVNVSSPNTPGLRALQERELLRELMRAVRAEVDALGEKKPPLLLKIAPDLDAQQRADIAAVVLEERIDGLIVSNTTCERPASLQSEHAGESGGLSGAPLHQMSNEVLREMYILTGGKVTLVGAGGVDSGAAAYAKIRAGASAVQLYSAMAFEGPPLVPRIKKELVALLDADGYSNVAQAIGADCR